MPDNIRRNGRKNKKQETKNKARGAIVRSEAKIRTKSKDSALGDCARMIRAKRTKRAHRTKNKEQRAWNKAPEAIVRSEAKIRAKRKEKRREKRRKRHSSRTGLNDI